MKKSQNFRDKFFKDTEGNIVIGERPNLPILVWIVCLILQQFVGGMFYSFLDIVSFGAIFTWAWLEIFSGTNYFRRLAGIIVMTAIIFVRLS
jgi:hypothetical protein